MVIMKEFVYYDRQTPEQVLKNDFGLFNWY